MTFSMRMINHKSKITMTAVLLFLQLFMKNFHRQHSKCRSTDVFINERNDVTSLAGLMSIFHHERISQHFDLYIKLNPERKAGSTVGQAASFAKDSFVNILRAIF